MTSTWDASSAVRQTLDELNAAWLAGRFGDLGRYLDEEIVMKGPGFKHLAQGRAAFIQTYVDFMSKSTVNSYTEANHAINVIQSTAVASYDWSMTWEQGGVPESAAGQDLFVFERRDVCWVAILRVILFS